MRPKKEIAEILHGDVAIPTKGIIFTMEKGQAFEKHEKEPYPKIQGIGKWGFVRRLKIGYIKDSLIRQHPRRVGRSPGETTNGLSKNSLFTVHGRIVIFSHIRHVTGYASKSKTTLFDLLG